MKNHEHTLLLNMMTITPAQTHFHLESTGQHAKALCLVLHKLGIKNARRYVDIIVVNGEEYYPVYRNGCADPVIVLK